ncbi:MAG: alanine:cation symporter family protein, partial [Gemmatimonadota bacterium]|nr:alanine:cation symporter family protein [Gemmatimonadota bacterium]
MRLRLSTIVTVFVLALLAAPLTGGPAVAQDTVAVGDSAARRLGGSGQAAQADTIVTQQPGDTAVSPLTEQEGEEPEAAPGGFIATADRYVGYFNTALATVFFWDVMFWDDDATFPLVVLWLVFGATFLTLRMGFINFRAFKHAVNVTRGKYSNPADAGEVSHFQALSAALSATVGLGNIAGVAIAVSIGGPGATFWMILAGLLGMSSKFAECTLGQQYRQVRPDGRLMGGAMYYLSKGLADLNMPKVGKVLAVAFAVLCVGGSLGGGNMFQVNQSMNALQETVPLLTAYPWVYGLIMVLLTGIVIIGGIRRIANVADKIVPFMCGI